jgi:hypothetical protein
MTTINPERAVRERDESRVRGALAREANTAVNELNSAANHAAQLLDNPLMAHPGLAGMRAQLLSVCVRAGAVAVDRDG